MFIIDKRNRIKLTKGDTATMYISIKDLLGDTYEIKPTDVIKFTVKYSDTIIIQKIATDDHYIIINHEDTNSLNTGLYKYDVELTTAEGFVYTIIPSSYFELTREETV